MSCVQILVCDNLVYLMNLKEIILSQWDVWLYTLFFSMVNCFFRYKDLRLITIEYLTVNVK